MAHIGVDRDSGLVHTVEATAANVHDATETSKLLTGDEDEVYGDSGYLGAEKRGDAIIRNKAGRKVKYRINRRPSQVKKLSKSRKESRTRKVLCPRESGARIRCRQETAAFPKNTIPRARKAESQIQYHVRVSESDSG